MKAIILWGIITTIFLLFLLYSRNKNGIIWKLKKITISIYITVSLLLGLLFGNPIIRKFIFIIIGSVIVFGLTFTFPSRYELIEEIEKLEEEKKSYQMKIKN